MDVIHEELRKANIKSNTEYKINKFLSLKLEDRTTVIFIAGKRFRSCKYLLLNLNRISSEEVENINSIDEIAETLNHELHGRFSQTDKITPREEFWGHCSNLQAWFENGYDSRLLHSNLSFPLLKRLAKEGDPQAQKVFKEEIVKRIESEYPNVVQYLIRENYLTHLGKEELIYLKETIKDYKITKIIGRYFYKRESSELASLFFEKTLELNPSDEESRELLREINETDEEKIARYLEILKNDPNRKKLKAKLIVLYSERKQFKRALNLLDSDIATEYTRETHELIRAIKQIEREKPSEKLDIWGEACSKLIQIIVINSNPVLSRYILNPRKINYRTKVLSKEVVHFSRKALEINDKNLKFKENLGRIFYLLDRFNEAIKVYRDLIQSRPNNRKYKFQLGKIYIKTKNYKKGIEVLKEFDWETIKSLNFKNIFKKEEYKFYLFSFWKAFGNFFYKHGNYSKASEIFADLLDFNTESFYLRTVQEITILNKLILCYRKTNQIDKIYELMDIELSQYGRTDNLPNDYDKLIKKYSGE